MMAAIDHGKPEDWATLDTEETRCVLGLKKYYMIFHGNTEEDALELAWTDLKTEFDRLKTFSWFK